MSASDSLTSALNLKVEGADFVSAIAVSDYCIVKYNRIILWSQFLINRPTFETQLTTKFKNPLSVSRLNLCYSSALLKRPHAPEPEKPRQQRHQLLDIEVEWRT